MIMVWVAAAGAIVYIVYFAKPKQARTIYEFQEKEKIIDTISSNTENWERFLDNVEEGEEWEDPRVYLPQRAGGV